ncbi:unnamed protein product [Clonostachys rosea f. rosea IK726]|uniref:Uncharacterized protein n=1 Tax=Clonostachys rosea f. rosea IK726 TaxID=1349383 RepID=A0ACA9UN25_BIOOC|nr:unnamed protein product [Clonostachys rosea f. rosea IK726]
MGETDGADFLSIQGQLRKHLHQDPEEFRRLLCSAWGVVLGCYTGLEDVCFGFDDPSVDEATATARLHIPSHATVQDVLPEYLLGPLPSNTTTNIHDATTPTTNALFNTLLRIGSLNSIPSKDGESTSVATHNEFPTWCKVSITVDSLTCQTVFSWVGSFMTQEQALHVNSTFETIVSQMLDRPHSPLSQLNYVSERSMSQILAFNSNTKNDIQKCIHQAISEQGDLRPEAEAVCSWDGSFSYDELVSLADRLACRLETSGVGPEVFVPICFDKSRWTIVAMLAVLKAGGIFVPLDPTHPVSRLQALSHKIEAKTILCSRHHLGMLEPVATELIPVDDHLFTELPPHQGAVTRGSWNNGAYMIFTSGTTGEPKGALIQHGALMSSAMAHGPAMLMDSNTRSLQFAASTFDVSITEILTCLILGGCVCVPSEEARLNDIEGAINELRPNWALLTPTFVKFINPANVPSMKTLVTGGEAMTQDIIRSWSTCLTLVNCYGPAETSVVSHVNVGMREGKNPLNIGRHVGIHCWVVDRYNHDRLMPIGAVGELLIEGHTLAREYYKEPEKTSDAFIFDPGWTKDQSQQQSPRRMYKTGDLVRYNSDGTFHIAGRKDSQIKFHGQRIELGEIEHHLNIVPCIKHGMVILPKTGFCKGRLLTMIQLNDALNQDLVPRGKPYELIHGELEEMAKSMIDEAKHILTERLPPYMIPSMWLAVEFIPRLQSGKLDRKQTTQWVENMSEDMYRRLNPVTVTSSSEDLAFASPTELELHSVWTHVLNLNAEQLGLGQSFLSVGGDSISAMQVMSECKKRGLGLMVRQIIGCKSIRELASHVKGIEAPVFHEEILEQPFELSPIQKLYFERPNHSQGHYNQSFLLRTNQRVLATDLRKAIETVIQRHSMLRARFSQTAEGMWQQRITNETASSYRLRTFRLAQRDEIDHSLVDSQTCLNAVNGPLLAADLIDLNGEEEMLFVVAHHLVIDLVSWRVILQEIEELLLGQESSAAAEKPLPFQTWCKLQVEHCQTLTPEQALPIQGIPDGNPAYWGMESTPNIYGQMARGGFEVNSSLTSLLLTKCHSSLRTEIPDVLLTAMIFSFGQTFTDRSIPPIFAEGHGRESWDPSIDLSRVIGWFTTIYPVFAGSDTQTSLIDTTKLVKDVRRRIPDKGRPYFASRWLTEQGKNEFSRHWPLEITFNYLGQYQQLEREGALFTPVSDIAGEVKEAVEGADVGPLTTCISLFEVSAVVIGGTLRFSFVFNQNMKHQEKIRSWISSCQQTLEGLIGMLSTKEPEPTLSDFPMLSLTYDRLELLVSDRLPQAGVTALDLVEDAYPCSPMQSGLLVSTTKNNAFYAAYTLHEVKSRGNSSVDPNRLANAWRAIVEAHPILRTIFVESVSQMDSLYDQVVLKRVEVPIIQQEAATDEDAISALSSPPLHQDDNSQLLHRFEICTTATGKVFCRLDISHVIMDGTSLSIVFRDLALAYDNRLKSVSIPQYRNYIKHLQEQVSEPGIDYWSSYLAQVEPCHFPVLNDGNTVESKELRYVRVTFEELAELQRLCDQKGVTFVNAIYAAWALTLRLYTASEEVCFGYLTSARDAPIDGIRDMVGPVINMVACRVNVADSTTLGQIMSVVQSDYLDSLAFRHIPLAEVQHALKLSGVALFNTALSYRKLPPPMQDEPDISFNEYRPTYDPDEYNVSINIEAGEKDMAIDLMYWTDTLSDENAANVASSFTKALSNILHNCEQPISRLDHLSERNHTQLSHWNGNMPGAIERCVHNLVEDQALGRPDAPAIASWDMNFTYSELDAASTRLAHHLKSLGVGLEVFVLICFEKSAFSIVAMMAVLKAGGVCVPLDPAHPDAALQLRAKDTGASIALVSSSLVNRFEAIVPNTVAVDVELLHNIDDAQDAVLPQVSPSNACFVIYTSGSTGQPKGVVLEHRGLATNAEYSGASLGYDKDSRVLQFASYTFDNSLAEIFTTLTRGGCVCVPSDHERLNDLAGVINRLQVTFADITPTVATFLQPTEVPTLKILALGGEAVTSKCVEIWRDYVSLRCCYGPSECSVNSTYSGDIARPGQATNIGRAIGSIAWVVDRNDHNCLVPVGCIGELLVDGPIVSRGYLNMPERTEQSFVKPPPWLEGINPGIDPSRRLYKTGDLVRYNCDGTLMYLGRKDTQVKLNGQRIELGEIEHHIEKNLPEGAQSAVELVVVNGKKSLACFISMEWDGSVPASSDETNILPMSEPFKALAKDLEVLLSKRVPAYMVPTMWLPVFQMPLTTSGKLNRRSLRLQAEAVPEASQIAYKLATKSGRAPSSEGEKLLARLWAAVLHTDLALIGVEDNFFKLGGDSVSAMRLVTLARKENISLTVASIFQKASLLDMVQSSSSMSKTVISPVEPFSLLPNSQSLASVKQEVAAQTLVRPQVIQDILPCTTLQQGLMALSNKQPGAYVAQMVYRLPEGIDIGRFKDAWQQVVRKESALRTRIVHTEACGFLQVVVDEAIEWSSVSSLSELQESERQLPSHNGGRLTHYTIAEENSGATFFIWTIHHVLYDGWCLPIILESVKKCYLNNLLSRPPAGSSYAHFIKYVAELDSGDTDKFWTSQLSDLSTQHFPRLPQPDYQASASSLLIHKTAVSRQKGSEITLATEIRAAWALTVSAYSSVNDVVFWETVTGRDAPVPGIEDMIGATLATIPRRIRLPQSNHVLEFLNLIQDECAAALPHQYASIAHIKRLSTEAAIACGAQNLIAINNGARDESDSFWDVQSNEMEGTNFYTYPIMVSFHIGKDELEAVVHFDQGVIPDYQMQRVMDHFAFALQTINSTRHGDKKLSELGMLSPRDCETLQLRNSALPPKINRTVHEMIQRQVTAQRPEKLSVVSWDIQLTYSELDLMSTKLASILMNRGIGSNSIVPLCLEKSALVVVSMLGVLKSGAAFVPLDPAHPNARINGILSDVEASILLCSPKHEERCASFQSVERIVVTREFIEASSVPESDQDSPTSDPDSTAYIIFTSGTTGKPKGTIVGHSAFCTGAMAHSSAMGMNEDSRVLQFASYTFDASVMEVLTTLLKGGTVCIPSDDERINDITGVINRLDVNWTLLTPSVAQLIQPSLVPGLKTLVLGGEAMSSAHIATWAPSAVKLMNAYGPSETAVVATVNPTVTAASGPSNIGQAVGGLCWIADASNHDKLVPIGAVGELLVEGPILAQGYLNNAQKTSEAFAVNPRWINQFPLVDCVGDRRMYKTGDLVKLAEDGSIIFQGRKDDQVKLNGQRLELSEVEHHLGTDPAVQYGLAAIPLSGPYKKRLVAVLSLESLAEIKRAAPSGELQVLGKLESSSHLRGIQERVAGYLPPYMVPSKWIILADLPLLPSGKLDRRTIVNWVENLDEATHQLISDTEESAAVLSRDATALETQLRAAWAKVLGREVEKIPYNQSFFQLGGDSISAMQMMSICRSSNIAVSVPQIMKSKSIIELASHATAVEEFVCEQEKVETTFELSPIQKVYFKHLGTDSTHFNQSVFVGTSRAVTMRELTTALRGLIEAHSMLRARFSMSGGVWSQRITNDVVNSYRIQTHKAQDMSLVPALIEGSQKSLDIVNGPLIAVDIFETDDEDHQKISIVAHHLIVDVVSWHIILEDLESLLAKDTALLAKPFSFQTWSRMQWEQACNSTPQEVFVNIESPHGDLSYWGMQDVFNVHGDAISETLDIDAHHSLLLVGACHQTFETDIVDVLIASLLGSFRQAFPDRSSIPPIFNEGHGREPWNEKLDLSRTVGWFTTLCPIFLPQYVSEQSDILDFIQWVKDFRRRVPGKGRPYFAHSLISQGEEEPHWPVEVAFNYLGHAQKLGDSNSVLKSLDGALLDSVSSQSDIGANVPRLALIEISASVIDGKLSFSFSFNKNMKHQKSIKRWMALCKENIGRAVEKLSSAKSGPTMTAFPLLPLAFRGVSEIQEKLSQLGIESLDKVEAAYPCSPVQQGILFTQIKNPDQYAYSITFEVHPTQSGSVVDPRRLSDAWQTVVKRHSSLRTIFVSSLLQEGMMDQVVLKEHPANIAILECNENDMAARLSTQAALGLPENQPPHRMRICKTPQGKVICVLEMSHAISDGSSMPILFKDLALAYQGTVPESHLPVFQDYIAYLQGRPSSKILTYWENYVMDVEPCYFPTLNDGVTEPKVLRALEQDISHALELQAFCTDNGITLSNVLQLAWALVLQTYTGMDDVCFGYLVSSRDAPVRGIDEAVGVFINMLICRVQLNPATSVGDLLDSVQKDLMTSMEHKEVSLAHVQHKTKNPNAALFNTAYSFQRRAVAKSMATGPLSFEVFEAQDPNEYDITVNVEVWDSQAELQLCYWSDKISDAHARNVASTFDQVLSSLVASKPQTMIGDLNMLSNHCVSQITSWNLEQPSYLDQCVHHIVDQNVSAQPTAPAVDAWDAQFTYTELDVAAYKLARFLVSRGIKPETYVPLCFEKSAWTVVAMMAVLKAGGAFVPLDPTHPPERINFLLESVSAKLVLCSPSLITKFEGYGIEAFGVGNQLLAQPQEPSEAQVNVGPNNPAYIIFTSGTTGLPKGTIIEHGAFSTGAIAHARAIKMTASSRVLQFASHTFDASIMEILSTLLVGGCVCIPSEQDRLNDLAAVINRFDINWTLLTPSVANVLKPGSVPSLQVLVTGGEAMSRDHIRKWADEAVLVNAYGPSETSVIAATSTKVDETGTVVDSEPATIGHAVGSRCWVVDQRNHNLLVPIGGVGELIVEGPIVARGYLNNETKTKEAFIDQPPWRVSMQLPGDRLDKMYKTGDLVTYNSDGSLRYGGRKDTQVKLNGQRIELGEIEHHVLANLPATIQSAVDIVVPQNKTSAKALAVFLAIEEEEGQEIVADIDETLLHVSESFKKLAEDLKSNLLGALPSYMVPTLYIPLTRMPWTLAGKLDRQRLRAIVHRLSIQQLVPYKLAVASKKKKPTLPMQCRLQKVWQKVLGLDANAISIDDNFFRLGGDSVGAMKLVAIARGERIALTVLNVFRHPKLSDMAAFCTPLDHSATTSINAYSLLRDISSVSKLLDELSGLCDVPLGQILDAYPCSSLQEGLMTLSLQQPGAYVAENVFKLPATVDLDRFKMAWQKTVDQVDILRSRIVNSTSSKFYQVVLQPQPLSWSHETDMSSAIGRTSQIPGRNGGQLTQYTLVEEPESGSIFFVWAVHHALYDAWSMPAMINMVEKFYLQNGATTNLPNVPFVNFVNYLSNVDVEASNKYWEAKFNDASPSHFPSISTATAVQNESSRATLKHTVQYQADDANIDITIPTFVRAAWALVVGSQAGTDDVVFGETLSGRDIVLDGVGDILGPVLTTVPTRVIIDRQSTIEDFLKAIYDQAAEVIPYQHAGLQNIKRLGTAMAEACNFSNLLVIQAAEESSPQSQTMHPVESTQVEDFFTYPLVVECAIEAQSLVLTVHHDEAVLSSWQMERIVYQFDTLVKQLMSEFQNPARKMSDLNLCSPQDLQIIKGLNNFALEYVEETVPALFLSVAAQNPEATAIHAWDGEISYESVRAYAMRLCKFMIDRGIKAETLIPCCMDKSIWTTISMMAVMLVGGVVVPLDPAHPPTRHAEIVHECQAPMVLCSVQYRERFSGLGVEVVAADSAMYNITLSYQRDDDVQLPTVRHTDAAFVIYTSGSTGKPKGVVIEHGTFCSSSKAWMKHMNLTSSSRVFHFASYAFDVAMGETLGVLARGGCVCIPSEEMRTGDLSVAMNSLRSTWAFLTPSVANIQDPSLFNTLQTLVCGGEPLTAETIKVWADHVTLMNGYGPAECTVFCMMSEQVSVDKDHTHIGHAMEGGHAWIVDPRDHNILSPLGCVGELLISGPILSRGYLNNPEKTKESFIENATWAPLVADPLENRPMRLYKTGDLVRYRSDGKMAILGRKDLQVKIHGQRLELGEIEAALDADINVRHALVSLPKSGLCKGRLVAIISLHSLASVDPLMISPDCVLISDSQMEASRAEVAAIQERLSETLPPYMVPTSWFVVKDVPLLVSGKLNRPRVQSWVATMDLEVYKKSVSFEHSDDLSEPETFTGQLLRRIWSSVLNMPAETLPTNQSLINLGGDSITAMQIMTLCRDHSIKLSLHEIIKGKSITELAEFIHKENRHVQSSIVGDEEEMDRPFTLSPIQQLYFNNSSDQTRGDQFNQSQLLLINDHIESETFETAIQTLVKKHSMLRSRFTRSQDGEWMQLISADIPTSYKFQDHTIESESEMTLLVSRSQRSIYIGSGPLFIVDLFNRPGKPQVVSLIAHHLVVDIVSWFNILRDLETFLSGPIQEISKPFSFQSWCASQDAHASRSETKGSSVLPFDIQTADFGFWGMDGSRNSYGEVTSQSFVVSNPETVALALDGCHEPMRTEPLDLFISALLQSFGLVFNERKLPTVFNEGHGRESWDNSIDIAQTVGWFTALCPVHISLDDKEDELESICKVKDVRRSIPDNGRQYFAHRYLTERGRQEFRDHESMEIMVNYLGRTRQQSKMASLLEPFDYQKTEEEERLVSDVGSDTKRLALIEISISVTDEGIQFAFLFNKHMHHQDRITQWISSCRSVLVATSESLSHLGATPTLSDLPLLPVNYTELQKLVSKSLPAAHITSFGDVEDIFPCSPMQVGILLSQIQDPGRYLFHTVLEVVPAPNGSKVDAKRLSEACKEVINYHAALRTIFINSVYRSGTFDQVVLKPCNTRVRLIRCREIQVMAKLNSISLEETNKRSGPQLPYQITICQTPQGKVFMKMEMNHAITDGASTSLLMRDITRAYDNALPDAKPRSYKEYIRYINIQSTEENLGFWMTYLRGVQPTEFPASAQEPAGERTLNSVEVDFESFAQLHSLASSYGVTLSGVILVAWALVLRKYTRLEDLCFGYLASGRDAEVDGIDDIMGPFINMLVFRFRFEPHMRLKDLLDGAQEDYLASLPHQHVSLARVNNALGWTKRSLFNTAVSIQNSSSAGNSAPASLSYEPVEAYDPSEYSVTVNVNTAREDEGILFRYWSDVLSSDQAEDLAESFSELLHDFIEHAEDSISRLRLFQGLSTPSDDSLSTPDTVDMWSPDQKPMDTKPLSATNLTTNLENLRFSATKKLDHLTRLRELLSEKLSTVWKETLSLETTIAYEDSFFELGGDSIIAMSMVGIAREAEISLTVADIFQNATFGEMVECLLEKSAEEYEPSSSDDETYYSKKDSRAGDGDSYEPLSLVDQEDVENFIRDCICPIARVSRASIVDVLPTTDFQTQSIEGSLLDSRWMLSMFYLDGSGHLDIGLLRESVANIVATYDILRTVFVPHGDEYLQVVLRQLQPEFRVDTEVEDIEQYTKFLEQENLQETPRLGDSYVRFIVAQAKSSNHHRIFMRISHAQYDGVCFPTILQALKDCYEGKPIMPTPPYASYVHGALGKITSQHYAYWKKLLEGSTMTDVVQRDRTALSARPVKVLKQEVLSRSLASLNITTATIIKAAWSQVLAQVTGASDILFGHLISGRNITDVPGIESVVGPCLNMVPVRVPLQASWTVIDLLRYIQGQQVDNMAYESLGFRKIIEKCADWGQERTDKNFSTIVQHQSMAQTGGLAIGDNSYTVGAVFSQVDPADFSVVTTPKGADRLEVCLLYAQDDHISPLFAEKVFDTLCRTIELFSSKPQSLLSIGQEEF